jgi:hypothetical protein
MLVQHRHGRRVSVDAQLLRKQGFPPKLLVTETSLILRHWGCSDESLCNWRRNRSRVGGGIPRGTSHFKLLDGAIRRGLGFVGP